MSCGVYHLGFLIDTKTHTFCKRPSEEHSSYYFCQMFKKEKKPEALKSLYLSPGYKKNQLVLCKNNVLQW